MTTHMCWAWAWYSLPSLSPVSTVWESVSVVSSVPVLSVELGLVPDLVTRLDNLLKEFNVLKSGVFYRHFLANYWALPRISSVRPASVDWVPVSGVTSGPWPRARGPHAGLLVISPGTSGTPGLSVRAVTCWRHVWHVTRSWVAAMSSGRRLLSVSGERKVIW